MSSPPLSTTAARIRPPVFADLQARIDRMAAEGKRVIPLHIGDTHLPPPAAASRVVSSLAADDPSLFRYGPTAGLAALRDAFARTLPHGADPADEILVGNGGTHALYCAARAVLDAGDEVLLASPYWPLAPGIFSACGAVPVDVPLTQRLYEDPSTDPAAVLAASLTPRTKAVYVITPNNPDGKVLTRAQVESIAAFAREHALWIFADEVYADVVFDGEHVSFASVADARGRTITLHSLSKSHALAGLRVGFVVAPPAVVASARRVSTHTAFNVSVAMQRAAVAALEDREFPGRARSAYREARDAAEAALAGAPVRFHRAEGATYLFLDLSPALKGRPLLPLLERAVDCGVLLAPGDAFGAAYASFARLCFTSVPAAEVRTGVERLREAIEAF